MLRRHPPNPKLSAKGADAAEDIIGRYKIVKEIREGAINAVY